MFWWDHSKHLIFRKCDMKSKQFNTAVRAVLHLCNLWKNIHAFHKIQRSKNLQLHISKLKSFSCALFAKLKHWKENDWISFHKYFMRVISFAKTNINATNVATHNAVSSIFNKMSLFFIYSQCKQQNFFLFFLNCNTQNTRRNACHFASK